MQVVFLNGQFLPENQAFLPITDRGFIFGDGVFTTIRINEGKIEFLQEHLQRLFQHCHSIKIQTPLIDKNCIEELISHNKATKGVWRLKIIVTGGEMTSIALPVRAGNLIMTLKNYSMPLGPCRLCLFPEPIQHPLSSIKSLAYLDRLAVYDFAQEQGYEEAIVCSFEGYLLESAFSNLLWSDGERLFIPDSNLPYLSGVLLNQIKKSDVLAIKEVKAKLEDLPNSANVYICNALTHVRPVIEINKCSFARNKALEIQLKEVVERGLY